MAKPTSADLATFLRRQPADTLIEVLLELARANEDVQARLVRMQLASRPDKLAAAFRKTLSGWRRSTRYRDWREAVALGREFEGWLDQVAHELLPHDPPGALALFEAFIEADTTWFAIADDSDGAIGDAVRAACRHWLQAAARCETPAGVWPERLLRLHRADQYGARAELLSRCGLLLDESAQRELVARFEAELAETVGSASKAGGSPFAVYSASAALSLLSESLRDPDIKVRATLRHSPEPNGLQRASFVKAYLDADRPADALVWLQDPWEERFDSNRQPLLAEALERLGRYEESSAIRQQAFEQTLSVFDLERWLEHLPEAARAGAVADARRLALGHADPVTAATLLMHLGDAAAAEERLLAGAARLDGKDYGRLVPLAKALREHELSRGETLVYRALLTGILERANARAYGHAARYWARLAEIASTAAGLLPLTPHDEFTALIRARHARKSAFWAFVNGSRLDRHDADEDEDEADR